MSDHKIECYQDARGEYRWRIRVGDDIVADSSEGYTDKRNALTSLFGIYFGQYDESFLELYGQWQAYAGVEAPPEPYVRTAPPASTPDADAPNYEATQQDSAPPPISAPPMDMEKPPWASVVEVQQGGSTTT